MCQRYPDSALKIVVLYAQAEEIWQALLPSSQNAADPSGREICFDAEPGSNRACPTHESRTAAVDKDDSLPVGVVQGMDLPGVGHIQH